MKETMQDERTISNRNKALARGAIVVEVLLGVKILVEIISGSATLSTTGWDILILLVMNAVILLNLYRSKTVPFKTSIIGENLPTEPTKSAKRIRTFRGYLPESLLTAAGLTMGSYFNSGFAGVLPTIILFLIYFTISWLVIYLWNEHNIKRTHQEFED